MTSLGKRDQHTSLVARIRLLHQESLVQKAANFGRHMRLCQTDVMGEVLNRDTVGFLPIRHPHQNGELTAGQTQVTSKYFTTREEMLQPQDHLVNDIAKAFIGVVDD